MSLSSISPQIWISALTRQAMIAVVENNIYAPLSIALLCGVFI